VAGIGQRIVLKTKKLSISEQDKNTGEVLDPQQGFAAAGAHLTGNNTLCHLWSTGSLMQRRNFHVSDATRSARRSFAPCARKPSAGASVSSAKMLFGSDAMRAQLLRAKMSSLASPAFPEADASARRRESKQ
jgi:hypothetical protein